MKPDPINATRGLIKYFLFNWDQTLNLTESQCKYFIAHILYKHFNKVDTSETKKGEHPLHTVLIPKIKRLE